MFIVNEGLQLRKLWKGEQNMTDDERWDLYEELKAVLQELNLTPQQYEEAIRKIVKILGL